MEIHVKKWLIAVIIATILGIVFGILQNEDNFDNHFVIIFVLLILMFFVYIYLGSLGYSNHDQDILSNFDHRFAYIDLSHSNWFITFCACIVGLIMYYGVWKIKNINKFI
jgi:hypothetical protein